VKRVLVTGSSGFIGKALCEDLLEKGIKVWGISRSEESPIDHPNYKHFKHDVRKEMVTYFPVDTIFHLASPASNKDFWDKPNEVAEIILLGTINVTKYAAKFGADLFYASSYGAEQIGSKYTFRDCYDVSKRAGETYVGDYPSVKLKSYTMRIPSVYGPGMPVHADKVMSNFIRCALEGEPPEFRGEITSKRTYIYIDDLIEQIHTQLENKISMVTAKGNDMVTEFLPNEVYRATKGVETLPGLSKTIDYFKSTLASASLEKDL